MANKKNTVSLLYKMRQMNLVMQKGERIVYQEIIDMVRDLLDVNAYLADMEGKVRAYALSHEFECDIMRENVLDDLTFPAQYQHYVTGIRETSANIPHEDSNCSFVGDTKCMFKGKMTTVVPLYGNNKRVGTLVVAKYDGSFTDDDVIIAEYAATVVGVELLHEEEERKAREIQLKNNVATAFQTLSYSEMEAINNIMDELDGTEGLLVASKIADRVGITRSVIVNALRKFESAALIETRSLGMKGTYIHVLNPFLLKEIEDRKNRNTMF